jgi:hypothetical protein
LNEVLPAPKDAFDAEWVEIANDGDLPADLAGWIVDDAADGAGLTLQPGSVVAPHGLLLVTLPRALFNNDGDRVRLLRPDRTEADAFSYDTSVPDISLCRLDGAWSEECAPTPGGPNEIEASVPAPETDEPVAQATGAPAANDVASEQASLPGEHPLAAMTAPRQPIHLRGASAGAPVYALAMPGSVYAGIWSATATPPPSPVPVPRRQAGSRVQASPPAPDNAPLFPIAGGLALVSGVGVAGHEYLRLRKHAITQIGEHSDADEEPTVG